MKLLIALTLMISTTFVAAAEKPNVLIIVSDDQGYVDAGFQGSKDVPTPHLDKLAASGVRCTSGYASHPFCSPTRAGLLTGRYQARFGHEFNPVYDPLDVKEGLPLTEKLLPQFLKEAGYTTGWIGKWHLGSSPAHTPWKRGFDETYGFIGGGHRFIGWKPNERQYTLSLTRNGTETKDVPNHLTTAFGDEAAAFIQRNKQAPWMLYVAFNAPHTPHEPTEEREAKFAHITDAQRRKCVAQISILDDAIGTITNALEKSEQTKRTLIFFMGDNGGQNKLGAHNGPLREGKGTVYEGGVRVPYLVSWPNQLPANKSFDQPIMTFDAFATALGAAGIPMPANPKYDSVNLVPHFRQEVQSTPHKSLFWRNVKTGRAIREGNWKLVIPLDKQPELYDLASDIGETSNVASKFPEIVGRLTSAMTSWENELATPAFLGSSVKNEDWGPGGANQKQTK